MQAFLEKLGKSKRLDALVAIIALLAVLLVLWPREQASVAVGGDLSSRMEAVLSAISGAGAVQVVVAYAADGSAPAGAVIVAQGAGDVRVRLELERAARALLNLPTAAVEVFQMQEG